MFPRRPLLFLLALIIAIILYCMTSGCATTRAVSETGLSPDDDEHMVVDVPEYGFMFDAEEWWIIERNRRRHETMPVVLHHQVYGGQVIVSAIAPTGEPFHEFAASAYEHETKAWSEVSPLIYGTEDEVTYAYFWRDVGRYANGGPSQERIVYARHSDLPSLQLMFFGAWDSEYEDEMTEQMELMVFTVRPLPKAYVEEWKRRNP